MGVVKAIIYVMQPPIPNTLETSTQNLKGRRNLYCLEVKK